MTQVKNLKDLIIQHDNNYNFDVDLVVNVDNLKLQNLSIIIPYYESGRVLSSVLEYLYQAINLIKMECHDWIFEVIIIDDGSEKNKASEYIAGEFECLKVFVVQQNEGRTKARNYGLHLARNELCLFMDSDVIVSEELIRNHLRVHAFSKANGKPIITVGFFKFSDKNYLSWIKKPLYFNDICLDDFRLSCTYGSTWIGCADDRKFVGKKFSIVNETDYFRKWPKSGYFGPWFLTNMVLGGFFIVSTDASRKANGFDNAFEGYGFTETSLPTKLIAGFGHYLVPVIKGGCIHIDNDEVNVSRSEKDSIFWKKHDFYFNHYLKLTFDQSIKGYGKI